jgi:hypothetical protein
LPRRDVSITHRKQQRLNATAAVADRGDVPRVGARIPAHHVQSVWTVWDATPKAVTNW